MHAFAFLATTAVYCLTTELENSILLSFDQKIFLNLQATACKLKSFIPPLSPFTHLTAFLLYSISHCPVLKIGESMECERKRNSNWINWFEEIIYRLNALSSEPFRNSKHPLEWLLCSLSRLVLTKKFSRYLNLHLRIALPESPDLITILSVYLFKLTLSYRFCTRPSSSFSVHRDGMRWRCESAKMKNMIIEFYLIAPSSVTLIGRLSPWTGRFEGDNCLKGMVLMNSGWTCYLWEQNLSIFTWKGCRNVNLRSHKLKSVADRLTTWRNYSRLIAYRLPFNQLIILNGKPILMGLRCRLLELQKLLEAWISENSTANDGMQKLRRSTTWLSRKTLTTN